MNHYKQVFETLCGYVSPLIAKSMLQGTLQRVGIKDATVTDEDLPRVVAQVGRSARLFVDASKLDDLDAVLSRLVGKNGSVPDVRRLIVRTEQDIVRARSSARQLCEELGARDFRVQKVATIVSELARNILSYAKSGEIELTPMAGSPAKVRITAIDNGPGIANLDEILNGRYRSRTGLGKGLLGSRRLADQFHVETSASGTKVEAEVLL